MAGSCGDRRRVSVTPRLSRSPRRISIGHHATRVSHLLLQWQRLGVLLLAARDIGVRDNRTALVSPQRDDRDRNPGPDDDRRVEKRRETDNTRNANGEEEKDAGKRLEQMARPWTQDSYGAVIVGRSRRQTSRLVNVRGISR
jgi:hypothetical protein